MDASRHVTLVLPEEEEGAATIPAAPGVSDWSGRVLGVVDNGLWWSMGPLVAELSERIVAQGAAGVERTAFDHLAADFGEQQAALAPFARRVAGAVAGLGH